MVCVVEVYRYAIYRFVRLFFDHYLICEQEDGWEDIHEQQQQQATICNSRALSWIFMISKWLIYYL